MHYMVFLAIESASTFSIDVVGAPFALMRGGASPRPFCIYIIPRFGVIATSV
jgi:hypothetical protein